MENLKSVIQHGKVKMKYIIIIPAYNEEVTIGKVVSNSLNYSDVLVVDDGSSDRTSQLTREAGGSVIKHRKNMGKGAALKTGIKYALKEGYHAMVMLDGDGQHDPRFIPQLLDSLDDAGMIICSRFLEGPPEGMALQRKFSNNLTTNLLKFTTGYHITDSQSGFRIFSREAARVFSGIPYDDYEFESEMLYQASLNNLSVKEIPIPSSYKGEKSYITGVKILKYTYYIFKLLLRDLRRRIKN